MKKSVLIKVIVIIAVAILSLGVFAACVDEGNYDIPNVSVMSGSISWTPIPTADSYKIKINGEEYNSNTSKFDISTFSPGTYTVTIIPIADGEEKAQTTKIITIPPSITNPYYLQSPNITLDADKLMLSWLEIENADSYVVRVYKIPTADAACAEGELIEDKRTTERAMTLSTREGVGFYAVEVIASSKRDFYIASEPAVERYEISKLSDIDPVNIVTKDGVITWDASAQASRYELIIMRGNTEIYEDEATKKRFTTNTNRFALGERVAIGGTYKVKIIAHNDAANVLSSNVAENPAVATLLSLSSPTNLNVSTATSIITLAWDKVTSPTADNIVYNVRIKTANEIVYAGFTTNNSLNITTQVSAKRVYSIEIYASDSLFRYAASDMSLAYTYSSADKLVAPVLSFDKNTGTFSWSSVNKASGYLLYDGAVEITRTDNATTSYTLPNNIAAGEHSFTLVALGNDRDNVNSEKSNAVALTKLNTPANIAVAQNNLTWSVVDDAEKYYVVFKYNRITAQDVVITVNVSDLNGASPMLALNTQTALTPDYFSVSIYASNESNDSVINSQTNTLGHDIKVLSAKAIGDNVAGVKVEGEKLYVAISDEIDVRYTVSIPTIAGFAYSGLEPVGGMVSVDLTQDVFTYLETKDAVLQITCKAVGNGSTTIDSAVTDVGRIHKIAKADNLQATTNNILSFRGNLNTSLSYGDATYDVYMDDAYVGNTISGSTAVTFDLATIENMSTAEHKISVITKAGTGFSDNFYIQSEVSDSITITKLTTPYVRLGSEGNQLIWDSIPNAQSYSITLTDNQNNVRNFTTTSTFWSNNFAVAGEYIVGVSAVGNNTSEIPSESASYTHNVYQLKIETADAADGVLTFLPDDRADFDEIYYILVYPTGSSVVGTPHNTRTSPFTLPNLTANNTIEIWVQGDSFRYLTSQRVVLNYDVESTTLEQPQLRIEYDLNGKAIVVWDPVKMANGYTLTVADSNYTYTFELSSNQTQFDLRELYTKAADANGEFTITVQAKGQGSFITDSVPSEGMVVIYSEKVQLTYKDNILSWATTGYDDKFEVQITQRGTTLLYPVDSNEEAEVSLDLRNYLIAGEFSISVITLAREVAPYEPAVCGVDSNYSDAFVGTKLATVSRPVVSSNKISWSEVSGAEYYNVYIRNAAGDITEQHKIEKSTQFQFYFSIVGQFTIVVTANSDETNFIESNDSDSIRITKLASPNIDSFRLYDNRITWDAVPSAQGYAISVQECDASGAPLDGKSAESFNSQVAAFSISNYVGYIKVSVTAKGNNTNILDSTSTNSMVYATKLSVPKNLMYNGSSLTWEVVASDNGYIPTYNLNINGTAIANISGNNYPISGNQEITWHSNGINVITIFAEGNTDGEGTWHQNSDAFTIEIVCTEYVSITFDTDGGTPMDDRNYKKGTVPVKPTDPEKINYKFVGWYTDDQLTMPYYFDTELDNNIIIYAKWESIIDSVWMSQSPDKTVYAQGDTDFAPDGGKLTVVLRDGTTREINLTADMVKNFERYTELPNDNVSVTISYEYDGGTYETEFVIAVKPEIAAVSVTGVPFKTNYKVGESFEVGTFDLEVAFGQTKKTITVDTLEAYYFIDSNGNIVKSSADVPNVNVEIFKVTIKCYELGVTGDSRVGEVSLKTQFTANATLEFEISVEYCGNAVQNNVTVRGLVELVS